MMRSVTVIIAFLFLVSSAVQAAGGKVMASKDYLKIMLSLDKNKYEEGEPIFAKLIVVNMATTEKRLAEPTISHSIVEYIFTQVSGDIPMPARWVYSEPPVPEDYGWLFTPGEQRNEYRDLIRSFITPLPPGRYTVYAVYNVPTSIKDVWHGSIKTPEVGFEVAETDSNDTAALKFKEARLKTDRSALEAAAKFVKLKDPQVGGKYSKYAGFYAAIAYSEAGDMKAYLRELRDYAKEHPGVPFYGKQATLLAGLYLYYTGDYKAARELFLRLPDSYEKQSNLKMIDAKLAKE